MFVDSALTSFYFPGSTSVEHLYVCGRLTALKGDVKSYKKVKVIHTYPSAKAASFAKKKKLCYETLKVSGKMKKVTKKKTSNGLMYSGKRLPPKQPNTSIQRKNGKRKLIKFRLIMKLSPQRSTGQQNTRKSLTLLLLPYFP